MAFTLRAVGSWLLLSGMGWLGLGLGGCWLTGVDGPGARCLLASVDGPGEIYSLRFGRWPCLSGCGGVGALLDCPQGGATQGGGGWFGAEEGGLTVRTTVGINGARLLQAAPYPCHSSLVN